MRAEIERRQSRMQAGLAIDAKPDLDRIHARSQRQPQHAFLGAQVEQLAAHQHAQHFGIGRQRQRMLTALGGAQRQRQRVFAGALADAARQRRLVDRSHAPDHGFGARDIEPQGFARQRMELLQGGIVLGMYAGHALGTHVPGRARDQLPDLGALPQFGRDQLQGIDRLQPRHPAERAIVLGEAHLHRTIDDLEVLAGHALACEQRHRDRESGAFGGDALHRGRDFPVEVEAQFADDDDVGIEALRHACGWRIGTGREPRQFQRRIRQPTLFDAGRFPSVAAETHQRRRHRKGERDLIGRGRREAERGPVHATRHVDPDPGLVIAV
ncbi:MAG: hypothetical protein IPH76_14615 [Xanthomonadales bacterium]|nr:hypothetical protein [Xanthomonadales bacterium]